MNKIELLLIATILLLTNGVVGCVIPDQVHNDTILVENRLNHPFSHPIKSDEFHIYIIGSNSILEGTVIFTIKDYNGTVIYTEKFPANELLGYHTDYHNKKDEKEDFIEKRITEFFDQENFYNPAIKENDNFDSDYSNLEIWEDIRSDSTAIGFDYLIGEEDGRRIAYSKKLKKVVMYFNCC